jgi:NifB/MoaA-like Fe-S oxidoreductase
MLQRSDAPDVLAQFRRLAAVGIEVHAQLVLVPGLNDGSHLEHSLADLADLSFSPVMSVGVVPVGLTRHHRGPFRSYRPDEMARVLESIVPWQARFRREHGVGWVYPADEWYLSLGREVPAVSEYDGFPQIENGVGMVRRFLGEWEDCKLWIADWRLQIKDRVLPASERATLVCGTLMAPLMMRLLDELVALTGLQVEVLPVVNRFFGPMVTVSGLLAGQDVVALLREHSPDGSVFLPRAMFDEKEECTLDDWTLGAVQEVLKVPVFAVKSLGEVVRQLAAGGDVATEFS